MLKRSLLLLMTILAKSFLTLVRRHLMTFSFFTAWHNKKYLGYYKLDLTSFTKDLAGLNAGIL